MRRASRGESLPAMHPAVVIQIIIDGRVTAGAYTLLDIRVPAGLALPPHVQHRDGSTLVVLEGELEIVLDGLPQAGRGR